MYGVGKRRAESALLALRASHGVRATILRLPIVQGEGDGSLRLWAYLERMLDGGPMLLPDGGTRLTAASCTSATWRAAIAQLVDGEPPREAVYNLAQPDIVPLRELARAHRRAPPGSTPRFVDARGTSSTAAGLDRGLLALRRAAGSSVLDPVARRGRVGVRGDAASTTTCRGWCAGISSTARPQPSRLRAARARELGAGGAARAPRG